MLLLYASVVVWRNIWLAMVMYYFYRWIELTTVEKYKDILYYRRRDRSHLLLAAKVARFIDWETSYHRPKTCMQICTDWHLCVDFELRRSALMRLFHNVKNKIRWLTLSINTTYSTSKYGPWNIIKWAKFLAWDAGFCGKYRCTRRTCEWSEKDSDTSCSPQSTTILLNLS